jgi:Tfp pilus assembly protein PilV
MFLLERGGLALNSRKWLKTEEKRLFLGFSLLEVIIASLLLAFALIPIYRSLTTGAAQEIDTTKLSMARKILESLRNELNAIPFKELENFNLNHTTFTDIGLAGIPITIQHLLDNQKKYKDFSLKVEMKYTSSAKSAIEVKGTVSYTTGLQKVYKEEIKFILVKP